MRAVVLLGNTCAVELRLRKHEDLEQCVEPLQAVHNHDRYPMRWPDDPVSWLSPSGLAAAWVVELGGQVMGHVALMAPALSAQVHRDAAEISRLFVSPVVRGQRVGAELLQVALDEARRRGWAAWLEVVEGDGGAARFYERQGWHLLDRRRASWTAPAGNRPMLREYTGPRYVDAG